MRDGKIFNRVFSAISLLLVIVVAVTAWMFIRVLKSAHERSAREKLEATALVLRPLVFDALEKKELPRLRALVKRLGGRAEIRITVINPDGVVLAESTRPEETMGNHA
ncbi:MAG: hypothetical protein GXP32_00375, partial [Kiritimatiellaeota bacterium]|nr:hypothetical protein [Kiritimatiellota bacterium]